MSSGRRMCESERATEAGVATLRAIAASATLRRRCAASPSSCSQPPLATGAAHAAPPLTLQRLDVSRDGGPPIVADDLGRQVLLRGINVNQLGDYYQADPTLPTTFPLAERRLRAASRALGFNVVRLVLSWSALEPDARRVRRRVPRADPRRRSRGPRAHGLYVVLDMHQDAWGKFIATPPGDGVPAGPRARGRLGRRAASGRR